MSARKAHILEEKWRSNDIKVRENVDFSSLLLSEKVLRGLDKAGYKKPSPIQLEAIPTGRFGKDLVVQAKSGTGKTLVFTIIALEMVLEVQRPQVLILAPTREIAFQICDVIKAVGCEFESIKCCCFIGGRPVADDIENIRGCQIVVGTPGRIHQLISMNVIQTSSIRLCVLDEADELMKKTFKEVADAIFLTLPKDKQIIATSATYPDELKKLTSRYFRKPFLARLDEKNIALLGAIHYVTLVNSSPVAFIEYKGKVKVLEGILCAINFTQCLIFCNLISRVETLCFDIKKWGFTTTYISSAKEQESRLKAIECLKRFKCKVLVTSDLTARGIDAENVDLIINFDVPLNKETYFHRVGRAGRYGSRGVAITFLNEKEEMNFNRITRDKISCYVLPSPCPSNLIELKPRDKHIEADDSTLPCEKFIHLDSCDESDEENEKPKDSKNEKPKDSVNSKRKGSKSKRKNNAAVADSVKDISGSSKSSFESLSPDESNEENEKPKNSKNSKRNSSKSKNNVAVAEPVKDVSGNYKSSSESGEKTILKDSSTVAKSDDDENHAVDKSMELNGRHCDENINGEARDIDEALSTKTVNGDPKKYLLNEENVEIVNKKPVIQSKNSVSNEEIGVNLESRALNDEIVVNHESTALNDEIGVNHKSMALNDEIGVNHKSTALNDEIVVNHKSTALNDEIVVNHKSTALNDEIGVNNLNDNIEIGSIDVASTEHENGSFDCNDAASSILSKESDAEFYTPEEGTDIGTDKVMLDGLAKACESMSKQTNVDIENTDEVEDSVSSNSLAETVAYLSDQEIKQTPNDTVSESEIKIVQAVDDIIPPSDNDIIQPANDGIVQPADTTIVKDNFNSSEQVDLSAEDPPKMVRNKNKMRFKKKTEENEVLTNETVVSEKAVQFNQTVLDYLKDSQKPVFYSSQALNASSPVSSSSRHSDMSLPEQYIMDSDLMALRSSTKKFYCEVLGKYKEEFIDKKVPESKSVDVNGSNVPDVDGVAVIVNGDDQSETNNVMASLEAEGAACRVDSLQNGSHKVISTEIKIPKSQSNGILFDKNSEKLVDSKTPRSQAKGIDCDKNGGKLVDSKTPNFQRTCVSNSTPKSTAKKEVFYFEKDCKINSNCKEALLSIYDHEKELAAVQKPDDSVFQALKKAHGLGSRNLSFTNSVVFLNGSVSEGSGSEDVSDAESEESQSEDESSSSYSSSYSDQKHKKRVTIARNGVVSGSSVSETDSDHMCRGSHTNRMAHSGRYQNSPWCVGQGYRTTDMCSSNGAEGYQGNMCSGYAQRENRGNMCSGYALGGYQGNMCSGYAQGGYQGNMCSGYAQRGYQGNMCSGYAQRGYQGNMRSGSNSICCDFARGRYQSNTCFCYAACSQQNTSPHCYQRCCHEISLCSGNMPNFCQHWNQLFHQHWQHINNSTHFQ